MLIAAGIGSEYLDADPAPLIRSAATVTDLRLFPKPGMDATPWDWVDDPAGMLFGWRDLAGNVEWQFRPHNPPVGEDGRARKYLFRRGGGARYSVLANPEVATRCWVVEGTKQAHAVAAVVGQSDVVIGIPGCSGWSLGGWTLPMEVATLLTGKTVFIALDADAETNPNVYDAGMKLADRLSASGSVSFVRTPGGGTAGLDDYLSTVDVEHRAGALAALAKSARGKPARKRPRAKLRVVRVDERAEGTLSDESDQVEGVQEWMFTESGKLRPDTIAKHVLSERPVSVAQTQQLAVYRGGVYTMRPNAVKALVGDLLRDQFNTGHMGNIVARLEGLCEERGLMLPLLADEPVLNCRNGMLDLRTLELLPHDPSYLSTRQVAVNWDPNAKAPRYLAWLMDRVGEAQVPVFEEAVSQFLDPSRPPFKALFLFGPSRSGKSTALRLATAMLGQRGGKGGEEHISAVSLQQLSDNQFAAAELYGKAMNVCADLPRDHVNDLSEFKQALGDDPITGNKKYGQMFTFHSVAQFMFSANKLPTVGEESTAYTNRIVPVVFPKTYEGREDPAVEDGLMDELEGILVRWVHARRDHMLRGYGWHRAPQVVREHFAAASDRVVQFISTCCEIGVSTVPANAKPVNVLRVERGEWPAGPSLMSDLFSAFEWWAKDERGAGMKRSTFRDRVDAIAGVKTIKHPVTRSDVRNIAIKPRERWETPEGMAHLESALFAPQTAWSEPLGVKRVEIVDTPNLNDKLFSATGPLGRR